MFQGRGPTIARPSKATPNTQCQKCLQRGHYTYECKAAAQERPYISRPSRTQQLLNPKLQPELGKVVVPEELLKKKGVADDILKKKEDERMRERDQRGREYQDLDRAPRTRRRRPPSVDSVATISTNTSRSRSRSPQRKRSRSRSPKRSRRADRRHRDDGRSRRHHHRSRRSTSPRRSPSPVRVIRDDPMPAGRPASRSVDGDGYRAYSRTRSRSPLPPAAADPMDRLASRRSVERSISRSRSPSPLGQRRSLDRDLDRSRTGTRERSYSRERSPPRIRRDERYSREGSRDDRMAAPPPTREELRRPEPPRERSLSPFSKRVALTKQMGGR